jgi:hypothetical protein
MTKSLAVLPEDTAQDLREAKENNPKQFYGMVYQLAEAGWPHRAIAEPFGVSRASAGNWLSKASQDTSELDLSYDKIPSVPVTTHGQNYRPKKIKPDVPQKDIELLRDLAAQAKQVTRWTAPNSPLRAASEKLEEKLVYYVETRKVPVAVIARHLGVTRRAIAQRIEKHKDKQ